MNKAADVATPTVTMDVLNPVKQGISVKEEIIYSTEVLEAEAEDVDEIVEIIEEIEEIIEEEEQLEEEVAEADDDERNPDESSSAQVMPIKNERLSQNTLENKISRQEEHGEDSEQEDDSQTKTKSSNRYQPNTNRRNRKVVAYDADDDWEDEDTEQPYAELRLMRNNNSGRKNNDEPTTVQKNRSVNGNKRSYEEEESDYKVAKMRTIVDYSDERNFTTSTNVDDVVEEREEEEEEEEVVEEEEEDEESQHEIVKSAENNLVYTVLGSKKVNNGNNRIKKESLSQSQEPVRYVKHIERLDEDTIPVEGTIYYDGVNMETVYVAEPVHDSNDQYQEEQHTTEQEEQDWDGTNEASPENQEQGEAVEQDQIFLHEDEEGQLYFKDDNGTLQPVYLTADGNYAIAENSGDEHDTQETTNARQTSSMTSNQTAKQFSDSDFMVPDHDSAASSSNANDPDNEDNTVTISLIISEDENGQKRTQVIIPTTDNLKCEICAKSFKTSFQLLRHNRLKHAREEDITTRNFPCDLCPKRYSDQNTLARHRKTHIGDRPFGCLECGKSFPTSTALRRHLTQHNPQSRPLPCIYCGRRFLEKSALTKHEQSHLAGDQRIHTCDVCHKSFLQAADLNLHKKNHDPDKKFDCEVCGREFNRLNNLQRHMMVHKQKQGGNQEILSCDVCGITYKFMSSLTRHMVTSHMNPEKLRQQAEEQRRKRENNYRRYLENRKMYETQHTGSGLSGVGRRAATSGAAGYRSSNDNDEDTA